jgi:hypothetical protein
LVQVHEQRTIAASPEPDCLSSGLGVGAVREVTRFGSYLATRSFATSLHNGGTLTCAPSGDGTHVDWVSGYTLPARGGGKVIELITAPMIRSLTFRWLA